MSTSSDRSENPAAHSRVTLGKVMRRPRWIAALLGALAVAGVFAALAQWQISRAAEEAIVAERPTEIVRELSALTETRVATSQQLTGSRVMADGRFVEGDSVVIAERLRVSGTQQTGYWVVAHFETIESRDLAVVIGWAETLERANSAQEKFEREIALDQAPLRVTGRFLPSEAPEVPDAGEDPLSMRFVAVGELVNRWSTRAAEGAYFGYVISKDPAAGLEVIVTPEPEQQAQLNALNVFYALEWIVFAGFAIYLWYRLARDAFERERDAADSDIDLSHAS